MLTKLLVILGLFVVVSLGQAPDCKLVPPTKGLCCMNIIQESAEEVVTQCLNENKNVPKSAQYLCARDTCIMKKKYLLDSDNKINKANFIKYLKQYLKEFSPSAEVSLEKCVAETETSECMPQAFLKCFYSKVMRECTSALWLKTEECTNLKKFYVDCPNVNVVDWTE